MPYPKTPPEIRFWRFVDKDDGCWEWQGRTAGRYGQFSLTKSKRVPAHRFSYELHFGEIPNGIVICHHCDNPTCVRPDHLFAGSLSDNMQDMIAKHGHPKQRTSYRYKLTENDVRYIRASNETTYALAERYGVDPTSIGNVRLRKTWRNVK